MAGKNGSSVYLSQGLIGTTTSDADGIIKVYINGAIQKDPEARRTLYDGVAYKLVK